MAFDGVFDSENRLRLYRHLAETMQPEDDSRAVIPTDVVRIKGVAVAPNLRRTGPFLCYAYPQTLAFLVASFLRSTTGLDCNQGTLGADEGEASPLVCSLFLMKRRL